MLGTNPALPGGDALSGVFALSVFLAGALLVLLAIAAWYAFRQAGEAGIRGYVGRGALLLIGAVLALTLFDRSLMREQAAERRALEIRTAELSARAVAPGSALACLDGLAGPAVETACEKALFATPEGIAAALVYVDAQFALLAAAAEYAARDRGYDTAVRRLRRALEADRFGLVAQMLAARGCNAADCVELKHLRDTGRVLANMRERTFDAHVTAHAGAWPQGRSATGPATADATTSLPPGFVTRAPSATTGLAPGLPVGGRYDFPSAASIPPVSIMNAEPTLPPEPEPSAAAPTAPRTPAQPARRQTTREPPPAPPLQVAPQVRAPTTGQSPAAR
jgi:hypothetical protein